MSTEDEELEHIFKQIAHQWRQPLSQINSIVFAIDTIMDEEGYHNERINKKLSELEALTKYMSNTIEDFKTTHKENNKNYFYIKDIIDEIEKLLLGSLKEKGINLELVIDNNLSCRGDKNRLLQVIVVIINNAKDALVDRNIFNAKIGIKVTKESENCFIKISDNAGGMTKSTIEKIFNEEFTTKHKSEGSGIGLNMAKKIIQENFNGKIVVSNCNEGTCFEIKI